MKPFTVQHFESYASNIVLDTGDYWQLEEFQGIAIEPILDAVRHRIEDKDDGGYEIWIVIPEGNAKTTLMAGVALYLCDFTPLPWIPLGASSRDQADILAQQAYQMIKASPGMMQRFRIYEGYRRVQPTRHGHPGLGDRGIKVHAADIGTNDGVIPWPIAICDEGHRYKDLSLYRLWRGKCRKRGASMVMISTAGEPGTEFETTRDRIRDALDTRETNGAHLYGTAGKTILHEWRVPEGEITNMSAVKQANPLPSITEKTLGEDFVSPTMDIGDWKRLKCNIPARSSNAAISEAEWDAAYTELRPDTRVDVELGVDVAWKHDTFAIVPLWEPADTDWRVFVKPEILPTPRDGTMLPVEDVKMAFDRLLTLHQCHTVVMDMARAEDIAAWLENERGLKVIDWSQGNAQAAEDYESFMDKLRNGRLKHTGGSVFRAHVMHAIARATSNDKRRFDRPAQSRNTKHQEERVIDGLVAAAMVHSYVDHKPPRLVLDDYRVKQLG